MNYEDRTTSMLDHTARNAAQQEFLETTHSSRSNDYQVKRIFFCVVCDSTGYICALLNYGFSLDSSSFCQGGCLGKDPLSFAPCVLPCFINHFRHRGDDTAAIVR